MGLFLGLGFGFASFLGLFFRLLSGAPLGLVGTLSVGLGFGLSVGLGLGLSFALILGLGFGLLETRPVLITSRIPKEARSRSLIAALTWLVSGLVGGLVFALVYAPVVGLIGGPSLPLLSVPVVGLVFALVLGLDLALRNGGWFVLLQKVAHRRLARAGNLPSPPYDFLEWGIEKQVFRRVGGGVRFRHNLIQQHLANSHQ